MSTFTYGMGFSCSEVKLFAMKRDVKLGRMTGLRAVMAAVVMMAAGTVCVAHHNQPEVFTFSDGSTLTNLYRSDGTQYGRNEREKVISTVSGGASPSYTFKATGYTQVGDFVLEDNTPTKMYIDGGYIDLFVISPTSVLTTYNYYIHDNQGSVRAVVSQSGALVQATDYSAYGVPSTRYKMTADNRLHLGLEWQPMKGLYGYYNNARFRDALLAGTFYQIDPLAEKYYPFSPYHYAAANPLRFTDPTGLAWLPQFSEDNNGNKKYTGFEWISPEKSYNEDGTLKAGLYEQAILFTDNGTFDTKTDYNMGSSTAIVYTSGGKTESFAANTMPSDPKKYATVPEGFYHATVGKHQGRYTALRLSDTDNSGRIDLGGPNPSNPSRNYSVGINIHKPGKKNKTGKTTNGTAISQGCLLIDITKWNDFISIFNTKEQVKNTIGVIIQRK